MIIQKMKKVFKIKSFTIIIITLILALWAFSNHQKKQSGILKIGFVTDWEYSQTVTSKEKNGLLAKELLTKTVSHYNYFFKPDLVIGGGDYLNKTGANETDTLTQLQEINSVFNEIKAPKFYCLGKKDYQADYLPEVKALLKLNNTYYSQIFKDINIIILDTTQNDKIESSQGTVEQAQLEWLKKELSKPQPALIFSHHSIIETPDNDTWRQNLTNQDEVLDLIKENNQKIIAIFSGNSKKDYITKKSGLPFANIGGLANRLTLGRFSDIKITQNQENPSLFLIDLENQGENKSTYTIKRNLMVDTDTRISLKEKFLNITNQRWFNLEESENTNGTLNEGAGGEPNIGLTRNGTVVAAFENKDEDSRIQVKIYKDGEWFALADENYPKGLISLGKGSNPNIETRGEDIFVIFTETDHGQKARLLQWSESQQKWNELSSQGFVSEKLSHEPTLIFGKNKKNLYIAFAEQIYSGNNQTQAKIKKWNGENWETIPTSFLTFADRSSSSVDEFDLAVSKTDDSIYLAYEEIKFDKNHNIKVKKWNGQRWNDLKIDKFYFEEISKISGSSPSIAMDNNNNLYLAFIENGTDFVHLYKYNQTYWQDLGEDLKDSSKKAIEPFIEIDENNNLYLAYSEHKDNIVMTLNNGKNTGEELIKTSAWRVRVRKLSGDTWINCEDDLNYGGYISKGSGKGDPALKVFENSLYVIFSDEENNYAIRVKKYLIK